MPSNASIRHLFALGWSRSGWLPARLDTFVAVRASPRMLPGILERALIAGPCEPWGTWHLSDAPGIRTQLSRLATLTRTEDGAILEAPAGQYGALSVQAWRLSEACAPWAVPLGLPSEIRGQRQFFFAKPGRARPPRPVEAVQGVVRLHPRRKYQPG